jgi:hypothetical protein
MRRASCAMSDDETSTLSSSAPSRLAHSCESERTARLRSRSICQRTSWCSALQHTAPHAATQYNTVQHSQPTHSRSPLAAENRRSSTRTAAARRAGPQHRRRRAPIGLRRRCAPALGLRAARCRWSSACAPTARSAHGAARATASSSAATRPSRQCRALLRAATHSALQRGAADRHGALQHGAAVQPRHNVGWAIGSASTAWPTVA